MGHSVFSAIRGVYSRARYTLFSRPYRILRHALFGRRRSQYHRFLAARVERNRWHPDRPGESKSDLIIRLRDEYLELRRQHSPKQVDREVARLERDVAIHALREDAVVRQYRRAERALIIRLSQPGAEGMRERFERGQCTCGA